MRECLSNALVICVLTLVAAVPAAAQDVAILALPLPFEFLNPGARSMALGSTFTGLADDATAAFTNPAGLTQLSLAEVSFEGRFRNLGGSFLERGRFGGVPTGIGIDTITGPLYGDFHDARFGPSFTSFVYPSRRWAIAGYRHEALHTSQSIFSQGALQFYPASTYTYPGMQPGDYRLNAYRASRDISLTTYGVSGAVKVLSGLSVGGGLMVTRSSLTARGDSVLSTAYAPADPGGRGFGVLRQSADATELGVLAGVQWAPTGAIRVGASFRRFPQFEYAQQGTGRDEETCDPTGRVIPGSGGIQFPRCFFKIPDAISAGVAVRITDSLMVAADYDRIKYSQLKLDYVARLGAFDFDFRGRSFILKDGDEFHVGLEYAFGQLAWTPAIRVGAWSDPVHVVAYAGAGSDSFSEFARALLPLGDRRIHVTGGGGVSISRRLEVNAATDLARDAKSASASVVVRF